MTLRPEWGGTACVLLAFAIVMGAIDVASFVTRWMAMGLPDAKVVIVTALVLGFLGFVASLGVRSAFWRVTFDRNGGTVNVTWTPLGARHRRALAVRSADVEDVALERDGHDNARIVLKVAGEAVPLTPTFTSDDLEAKVRALRAFLV